MPGSVGASSLRRACVSIAMWNAGELFSPLVGSTCGKVAGGGVVVSHRAEVWPQVRSHKWCVLRRSKRATLSILLDHRVDITTVHVNTAWRLSFEREILTQ